MSKNRYFKAFLSSTLSVIPIIAIVILLSFIQVDTAHGRVCMVPLGLWDYIALLTGSLIMIIGMGLFQIGSDLGLAKVGEYMGSSLSKQSHLFIVILFSFLLGALITVAEPSILVVASQVNIDSILLIVVISVGVGIFCVVGILRIVVHASLKIWFLTYYFIMFMLICLIGIDDETRNFLPFIFDAGGITTGSATVPFILSLGAGVAAVRGGRHSTSDSFGLVGMASIGPIISMTLLLLINKSGFEPYVVETFGGFVDAGDVFIRLGNSFIPAGGSGLGTLLEVLIALLPIIVTFVVYELIFIRLPKAKITELINGFIFSYLGLVIFLSGVGAIMTPIGTLVGVSLGNNVAAEWGIIGIAFVIGLVTVLCEPAVHVLTTQMVEISGGTIKRATVIISLALGVGVAIGLSTIRTLFDFSIMYIIVPGYIISIVLMFFTPDIFVAMAFDAGGTASGPMSVCFILPMIIGITQAYRNLPGASIEYYTSSFGVVALIALTPIITIQILGLIRNISNYRKLRLVATGVAEDVNDAQIIHFA